MTTRAQQIEQVAALIATQWEVDPEWSDAAIAAYNAADGWEFSTSAPLGNTIRHSGVVLTSNELTQAIARAHELAAMADSMDWHRD